MYMVYTDVHPIILYLKLFIHKISTDMYCIVIITVYCTVHNLIQYVCGICLSMSLTANNCN